MTSYLIFIGSTVLAMLLLYIFAQAKGGITKNNLKDWRTFVVAGVVVGGLLLAVSEAKAEELEFFSYAGVSLGLEYNLRDFNPACEAGGNDDRINSNGQIYFNVVEYGYVTLDIAFIHHSCAINDDLHLYDAVGPRFNFEVRF